MLDKETVILTWLILFPHIALCCGSCADSVAKNISCFFGRKPQWKWNDSRAGKTTNNADHICMEGRYPKPILQLLPFSWSRIICFSGCLCLHTTKISNYKAATLPKSAENKKGTESGKWRARIEAYPGEFCKCKRWLWIQHCGNVWQMSLRKSWRCLCPNPRLIRSHKCLRTGPRWTKQKARDACAIYLFVSNEQRIWNGRKW